MLVDPDGMRIIPASEEASRVIIDGANRVLQENNPFYFDKELGEIKYTEFSRGDFSPEQLELVDRYVGLIDSETDDIHVYVVDFEESIAELGNKSLREIGGYGATKPYTISDSETGERKGTEQHIFIARNPERKGKSNSYGNPTYEREKSWMPSLTGIHEIAGHAYLKAFHPRILNHNSEVEKFENRIRKIFMNDGAPVKGRAQKH
jgi:hypothetical protein